MTKNRHIPAFLCVILSVCVGTSVFAQDTLQAQFDEQIADAKKNMMGNPATALTLAEEAEATAKQMPMTPAQTKSLGTSYWLQAEANIRLNQTEAALPLIEKGIGLARSINNSKELEGYLLLTQGRGAKAIGDTVTALTSFLTAYDVFSQTDNKRQEAIALQNIGSLYNDAQSYERAIEFYDRAYQTYPDDPMLDIASFNNRARAYDELRQYEKSLALFGKALDIAEEVDSPLLRARILSNIASVQVNMGEYGYAEGSIAEGLELTKEAGAEGWAPFLWGERMQLAHLQGDDATARSYAAITFDGVDLAASPAPFREFHETAYQVYQNTNEFDTALAHLAAFKRLDDQARAVAVDANNALMAAQFEHDLQAAEIEQLKVEQLEQQIELSSERRRNEQTLFFAILVFTAAGIVVALWQLRSVRRSRDAIQKVNKKLEAANMSLQKANRVKTDFLASTTHEIRTPLNGILGLAEVLARDEELSDTAQERLSTIRACGEDLHSIVSDILDISAIEANSFDIMKSAVNPVAIVEAVARNWRGNPMCEGIELEVEADSAIGEVVTDRKRFRQVVNNLVSNAVKFTETGKVSVFLELHEGQKFTVKVADTGIGIAPENHVRIFDAYTQGDQSSKRKYGGTGLGLSIAQKLARLLDGDITVDSTPGAGSIFTVTLPYEPVETLEAQSVSEEKRDDGTFSRLKVLYAEDNTVNQMVVSAIVSPLVGQVDCVENGALALEALQAGDYDLILMDNQMPDVDGITATQNIRTLSSNRKDTYIIAVTADAFEGAREKFLKAGMDDYLAKPVTQEMFEAALERYKERGGKHQRKEEAAA